MGFTVEGLLAALDLQKIEPDHYRADNVDTGHNVVFGGQLLAQSIAAARRGDSQKAVKTLHIVFARTALPDSPLDITVDRLHSGRSLASSTITISQDGRLCTRATALLTADEPDLIHHADPPAVRSSPTEAPAPSGDEATGWEVRIVGGTDVADPNDLGPADLDVWSRFCRVPDASAIGQALLAYATDGFLIGTAMRPHLGISQDQAHKTLSTGVLSHTITFHEPFSATEWLLLSHHSPYAGRGRAYGCANVFRENGQLVASFVQDSMIRAMSMSRPAVL